MGAGDNSRRGATVIRRWLTSELKRLRLEAGLSQADVAKALSCRVPKVSLMENGQRGFQDYDLEILFDLYGIPEEQRQGFMDAAKCARRRSWWERGNESEWLADFVGLEQGADQVRTYQPGVVHGLLQTPEYSEGVVRQMASRVSDELVAHRVEQRIKRQRVLQHETDPLKVWAILDEAVLHRLVVDDATMLKQLDHLAGLATSNPNITIQILPFARAGAFAASLGAFTILSLPWGTSSVVYMEHRTAADFLDAIADINEYDLLFDQLQTLALSPEESVHLITQHGEVYGKVG